MAWSSRIQNWPHSLGNKKPWSHVLPCILTGFQGPFEEKQTHNITDHLHFTVEISFFLYNVLLFTTNPTWVFVAKMEKKEEKKKLYFCYCTIFCISPTKSWSLNKFCLFNKLPVGGAKYTCIHFQASSLQLIFFKCIKLPKQWIFSEMQLFL